MYLPKDFIETAEGLIFAVVESNLEQGKVLCFLRYIYLNGHWQKVNTDQANEFLTNKFPHYLYYSSVKEAHLHAVTTDNISNHHQPRTRLKNLLKDKTMDDVENDLILLCHLLKNQGLNLVDVGVTGSILIAAQKQSSDIDLVFYTRESFNFARQSIQKLISQGECFELSDKDWHESFDRRSCDLNYEQYVWHEKRKFNKAVIKQRKFDLSFVSETVQKYQPLQYKKLNPVLLKVQIIDDSKAFDYPAEFFIQHQKIKSIVCYTATYTGQAQTGEWVEVAGLLEESSEGILRIVVGSSREASGEYIRVINEHAK
ncbi:MAG: hypothetical protein KAI44_08175 [Methylococcales bacterium]|nr:hypothetical protein [Methylococcales bacterium]